MERSIRLTDANWSEKSPLFITELDELYHYLNLPNKSGPVARLKSPDFPLLVPKSYLSRIPKGDPEHPLLLQVMPRPEEMECTPGFHTDPVGEDQLLQQGGTLRKYPGRLLIVASSICAVHCRFCFRRHLRDRLPPPDECQWTKNLAQIEADPSIHEVILSGGDPLMLADEKLAELLARLSRIRHVARLRIHTRVPVVLPQRITKAMMEAIHHSGAAFDPLIVVIHVNHPAEIDETVAAALAKFRAAGIVLLSQSVLLRRVNDRVEVLAELFERLVNLGVIPYYLHQLDRVAGAAHFEVPEAEGVELIRQLRAILPGYAVPRYVRETVGETSKRLLA